MCCCRGSHCRHSCAGLHVDARLHFSGKRLRVSELVAAGASLNFLREARLFLTQGGFQLQLQGSPSCQHPGPPGSSAVVHPGGGDCGANVHFLRNCEWSVFSCAHLPSFSSVKKKKMSAQIFCSFLIGLFVFLALSCKRSFFPCF